MPHTPAEFHYWAKTTPDGQPGISVLAHNQNVGWCAKYCAAAHRQVLALFGLTEATVAALAALHDIGKISQGFQCKCQAWVELYGLDREVKRWVDRGCISDHGLISQYTVANLLTDQNLSMWWAIAVGAHHGRVKRMEELGMRPMFGMQPDEWEAQRQACAVDLINTFGPLPTDEVDPQKSASLWWVAGLISVADWIGSNEEVFSSLPDIAPAHEREEQARCAVAQLGLGAPTVHQNLSFQDLFQFDNLRPSVPNALQVAAYETISEPGVYVIEAPMGMGKTEAALWAAYRLIAEGKASGLYFALPTQVTSNRIHLRVEEYVRRLTGGGNHRVHLVHANSWLRDDLTQPTLRSTVGLTGVEPSDQDSARTGRDWFASSKRAILASFGVGTVDQALLGVVAAKHFFVRRFALAGKVVVIDEVHSYDLYTGTLIKHLCEILRELGCTVILLSATLTASRRNTLVPQQDGPSLEENEPYPLISGTSSASESSYRRAVPPPGDRNIALRFIGEPDAFGDAWSAACKGACVLWICNTIGSAQAAYRRFQEYKTHEDIELGLLHSRFPFFRREELENHWMARLGKSSESRGGCILVATQVVEQSVDLDADLLVTELAPTDMLLQRIGRLWRHDRPDSNPRPLPRAETWVIVPGASLESLKEMTVNEIVDALKPSSKVYKPYVLLRTLEEWQRRNQIAVPADIRLLLENTYRVRDDEPVAWQNLDCRKEGEEFTLKIHAETQANVWQIALDDVEGKAGTRVSEIGTVPAILADQWDGKSATLLQGDHVVPAEATYRLKTAKAIHRHLVKVPDWVLKPKHTPAAQYIYMASTLLP